MAGPLVHFDERTPVARDRPEARIARVEGIGERTKVERFDAGWRSPLTGIDPYKRGRSPPSMRHPIVTNE
jgi:hypothetical protein